jgi:hypothetical protein
LWSAIRREIVEALIREVDDDASPRCGWKNVAIGKNDLSVFRGKPRVNSRICGNQLNVSEAAVSREVDKSVIGLCIVDYNLSQHIIVSRAVRIEAYGALEHRTGPQKQEGHNRDQGSNTWPLRFLVRP